MAGSFAKYVDAGSLILTHFSARFEDVGPGGGHGGGGHRRNSMEEMKQQRDQEQSSIALLKRQATEKFGKKTVFAAEDLGVYCVAAKDPENRDEPSLVFPRQL